MTNEHVTRFNLAAREYHTDRYPGRGECMRTVLELLDPQEGDVILDVGCGPGPQLIQLAPFIKRGYGLDPAGQMVGQAQQAAASYANLRFFVGSAENFSGEMRDAGINKIFSNYALHHLPDEAKGRAVQNLAALLPDKGILVLGDLMFSDNPENHQALFDVVGYGPGCDTPARLALLGDMFRAAGLSIRTRVLNPLVAVIKGTKI